MNIFIYNKIQVNFYVLYVLSRLYILSLCMMKRAFLKCITNVYYILYILLLKTFYNK